MKTRTHQNEAVRSSAVYSRCEVYRYSLTRRWGDGGRVVFVMLNPSTADERRNDPTVERCQRRAQQMGFGAMQVVNIFAYRATDPRVLRSVDDPVGAGNDRVLKIAAKRAQLVLCAWGAHGVLRGRGAEVEALLRECASRLWHLGLTRTGMPRHPLYTSYAVRPSEWC